MTNTPTGDRASREKASPNIAAARPEFHDFRDIKGDPMIKTHPDPAHWSNWASRQESTTGENTWMN